VIDDVEPVSDKLRFYYLHTLTLSRITGTERSGVNLVRSSRSAG